MLKIQNAATSYPWTSVANYDSEFRLKVMDDPSVSWASLDLEIFLERVLNVQNKTEALLTLVTNPNQNCNQSNPVKKKSRNCILFNQNDSKCRFGKKCKFAHRCNECRAYGSHGASNCKKKGTTGTNHGQQIPVINITK